MKNETLVEPNTLLNDAVEAMILNQNRAIYIIDESKKMLGIISEGDIIRRALNNISFNVSVDKVMIKDFKFVDQNFDERNVIETFIKHNILSLPVVDFDGKLIDILDIFDFIK